MNTYSLLNFQDTQYFSDSEHQLVSSGSYSQRQELRRLRNRTLSGLDTLRMGSAAAAAAAAGGAGGLGGLGGSRLDQPRPASATGLRPITPSFANEKENGQNFVDFNPAGKNLY